MKQPITLWVGTDLNALNHVLNFIRQYEPETLPGIRFAGESVLQSHAQKLWAYHLWVSGYFESHIQVKMNWTQIDSKFEGVLVPLPDAIINMATEPELVFEDHRLECLNNWENLGWVIDYGLLEKSLNQADEPVKILDWIFSSLQDIASATPLDIPLYRALQACEIWRYEGLFQWREELQLPALNAFAKGAATPGTHALLSLFKRYAENIADTDIDSEILNWKDIHQVYLRIYTPTEPLVQYVIFTYNRLKELKNAVNGVIQQTDPRWQLLILDHGSTDQTPQFCQDIQLKHPHQIRIKRYEVNQGRSAIWSHLQDMMQELDSPWICFISDDDLVLPHHLSQILNFIETYPWLGYVFGGKNLINEQGQIHQKIGPLYHQSQIVDPEVELQRILKMRSASPHFVVRKSILKDVAKWDPFVKGQYPYGMHDTTTHIVALGLSEVGCIADILSHISFAMSNTFLYEDVSEDWFAMANATVSLYHQLLGKSYPLSPVKKLYEDVLDISLKGLYDALNSEMEDQHFKDLLALKNQTYLNAWQFKQSVFSLCSPDMPFLFQQRSTLVPYSSMHG